MGSSNFLAEVSTPQGAHLADEIELSIVMPCLNESATIGVCIRKAQQTIDRLGLRAEIVIGDNGSDDGSQSIAQDLGARVVPVTKRGYGAALQGAIEASRGTFVLMGDSDDSYDFTQLGPFVDKLRDGYDLVMGNRFRGGILPGAMPPLHRYLGNPVLTAIGRLFFKCPVADFHCGLRAFRRSSIQQLQLRTLGMEFASEMVVKATLFGMRVTEIPTTLAPDGRNRSPHLRTWRDGWRHLRFLLLYSPRWLFLYPGVVSFVLGVLATIWLLPHARTVGSIKFDVDTLLFSAMSVLIGFQSINFAAFTKVFAITRGLLPEDPRMNRVFRHITLETGLIIGGLLLAAGVTLWLVGFGYWREMHFGNLDPSKALRIVIPGIVSLTLGFQVILSSFFLSVLGMEKR